MKNTLVLFICLFFFSAYSFSQQDMVIKGRVIDEKTRKPVAAVNVFLKSDQSGTVTNEKGDFMLPDVSLGDTMVISCLGYDRLQIPVDSGLIKQNVYLLHPVAYELDDVSVTLKKRFNTRDFVKKAVRYFSDNIVRDPYVAKAYWKEEILYDNHISAFSDAIGYFLYPGNPGESPPFPGFSYFYENTRIADQDQNFIEAYNKDVEAYNRRYGITNKPYAKRKIDTYFFPKNEIAMGLRVWERRGPLNPEYFSYYHFSLDSLLYRNNDRVLEISFNSKNRLFGLLKLPISCYGKMWINTQTMLVEKILYENYDYGKFVIAGRWKGYVKDTLKKQMEVQYIFTRGYIFPSKIKYVKEEKFYTKDAYLCFFAYKITPEIISFIGDVSKRVSSDDQEFSSNCSDPWVIYDPSLWVKIEKKYSCVEKISDNEKKEQFERHANKLFWKPLSKYDKYLLNNKNTYQKFLNDLKNLIK